MKELESNKNEILIYEDDDNIRVEVFYEDENVWLNTEKIAELFSIERSVINKHINNVYGDEELEKESTCAKIAQVQKEGNRQVKREIDYFNLDMIISIGFRTNSKKQLNLELGQTRLLKII